MIQFNLLPDVKQQFVKARRTKRLVTLASIAISGVAIFILLLLLLSVDIVQKKTLRDLNGDIKSNTSKLTSVTDLNKTLTVQNQLDTLTGLHDDKAVTSRLYTYVSQLTPGNASISTLNVDFVQNTISITGEAPSLDVVNTYVDTLKATTYGADVDWKQGTTYDGSILVKHNGTYYLSKSGNDADSNNEPGVGKAWKDAWTASPKAFSSVVLSAFGRDDKGATYTITSNFDPLIFNNSNNTLFVVPTASVGPRAQLFQKQAGS